MQHWLFEPFKFVTTSIILHACLYLNFDWLKTRSLMLLALFFTKLVLLHVHVHVEVTHTFCTCRSDAILQKVVLQCKKRLFYRGSQLRLWILVVVDSVHVFELVCGYHKFDSKAWISWWWLHVTIFMLLLHFRKAVRLTGNRVCSLLEDILCYLLKQGE